MIPIDLDINMLRCFKEVVETGSFTRAGSNIGLTQSGVSVKIRRLEERLNAKIFNRTSKSLSLTHEGDMLLDYAGRILSVHDEAVGRLTSPLASGNLRVGLIDYFLPELLPSLLSKFRQRYPNIHLEVVTDAGMNLMPLYEKGELDLFVAGKNSIQKNCKTLIREPLIWVIGKDTEPVLKNPVHLALLPSPCSFRRIATESIEKNNMKWEVLFTGTSIANIQAAVQAGMGLSILPLGALKEGIKKAPASMGLPELPMYTIALVTDEQEKNEARDVFISYLEAELDSHMTHR